MRVKLVVMIRIAGASERTVSRMTICMAAEKFSRLVRSGNWIGLESVPVGAGAASGLEASTGAGADDAVFAAGGC